MNSSAMLPARFTTTALLVAEALLVTIPFFVLGSVFNFPDILREPAQAVFTLFSAHQSTIVFNYYLFLLSSIVYAPLSYFLVKTYRENTSTHLQHLLIGAGLATMIFQTLGFVRWIFFMPWLSHTYLANPGQRETVSLIYETMNRYAGMSVGEHLGFIAMGSWVFVLALMLWQSKKLPAIMSYSGMAIGAMLIVSVGEQFGGQAAPLFGLLNLLANTAWTFWMFALAGFTFLHKTNINWVVSAGENERQKVMLKNVSR